MTVQSGLVQLVRDLEQLSSRFVRRFLTNISSCTILNKILVIILSSFFNITITITFRILRFCEFGN